jgi:hypothetical protein
MAVKEKKREYIPYMVLLIRFPSLETRETYFQKGSGRFNTETLFYGYTEQWASVRFFRACRQMHQDPLIQGVMVYHNSQLVVWASSGVPPTWSMPELAF